MRQGNAGDKSSMTPHAIEIRGLDLEIPQGGVFGLVGLRPALQASVVGRRLYEWRVAL